MPKSICHLKFLTKSGCCLCDRGLFLLQIIQHRYPVKIEILDISQFPQYSKYKNLVPTILLNEKIVSSMKLDGRKIRQSIEKFMEDEELKLDKH